MGPTTRANHARYAIDLEHIKHTRDPAQVIFDTTQNKLPLWRCVIYMRYVQEAPAQIYHQWTDSNKDLVIITVPVPSCIPSPPELFKTFLQLKHGNRSLITITLYHTTGRVLVQGNVCPVWVGEEFDKLKALVSAMSGETLELCPPPSEPEESHALSTPPPTPVDTFPTPSPLLAILPPPPSQQDSATGDSTAAVLDGQAAAAVKGSSSISTPRHNTTDLNPLGDHQDVSDRHELPLNYSLIASESLFPCAKGLSVVVSEAKQQPCIVMGTLPSRDSPCLVSGGNEEISKTLASSMDEVNDETAQGFVSNDVTSETVHTSTQCSRQCCDRCTEPVVGTPCFASVTAMITDLKLQFENQQKELHENLKAEIDALKKENSDLQRQVSRLITKMGKVDAIESRQKELLARQKQGNTPPPPANDSIPPFENTTPLSAASSTPPVVLKKQLTHADSTEHPVTFSQETCESSAGGASGEDMGANPIKDRPPQAPRLFSFRLPPPGKVSALLIGDSNLQRVDRRRLDPSGATCVRTLRGVKAGDLAATLETCDLREDISRVVVHVGTNDCASGHDTEVILQSFQRLTKQVRRAFPSAAVAYTAILPQGRRSLQITETVNQRLAEHCVSEKVLFLQEKAFYTPQGQVAAALFSSDKLHLSLRQVKRYLYHAEDEALPNTRMQRKQGSSKDIHNVPVNNQGGSHCNQRTVTYEQAYPPLFFGPDSNSRDLTPGPTNSTEQKSKSASARRWETSVLASSNNGDRAVVSRQAVPVPNNHNSQPPVDKTSRATGTTENSHADVTTGASIPSLQPLYHRPDAVAVDPHAFSPYYGNYGRPIVPWPQATPPGLPP